MRVGDVGSVSQVGDLLAFSLALVLVMSMIYQIETVQCEDGGMEEFDWPSSIVSIRNWKGFDPDQDGIVDLTGIQERVKTSPNSFPIKDRTLVTFILEQNSFNLSFIDGHLMAGEMDLAIDSLIHGFPVVAEFEGNVSPCLMEVSIFGGRA
jgi:hypothetical protein